MDIIGKAATGASDSVLRELLGLSGQQLTQLHEEQVV